MSSVKAQLEDLVFQVLNPTGYKDIDLQIKSTKKAKREKL